MQTTETNPLISIIIPIYNIMDCLEKCVESVCVQTYQNLEILLVDDGSTDGTELLCEELAKKDARIRVFHKQNGGSSSARNLGLKQANGEYIGFVDSDDYIDCRMIETLYQAIQKHQVPMAQISRDEIDVNGNRMPDVCIPPKQEMVITSEDMLKELLLHKGDCSFCTRLTKKELFQERQFPEGKLNEDFFLLTNMLTDIDRFVILPQQYYHVFYRIGSNSRKKNKDEFSQVFTDIVDNADSVAEIVENKYPNLKTISIRFGLYQRLDYLLHIPIARMTKDNLFYQKVCGYLKQHFFKMLGNPHLTAKNKCYLTLFTIAPKMTRQIHAKLRHI